MRNFTFKGLLLTAVFMLLGCLSIQAANDDLITKQITINLDKAGTLPNKIASSEMYKITNLEIIGEINGTDWNMIREMAGRDNRGYGTEGKLSVLDLSEAKIVAGGDYYYYDNLFNNKVYTSNDEIGEYSPIEVIPAGRVKLVNPLQPENANSPIEVIPTGRVKLVNPLQP